MLYLNLLQIEFLIFASDFGLLYLIITDSYFILEIYSKYCSSNYEFYLVDLVYA